MMPDWSLSPEVQSYILFPAILMTTKTLRRYRSGASLVGDQSRAGEGL